MNLYFISSKDKIVNYDNKPYFVYAGLKTKIDSQQNSILQVFPMNDFCNNIPYSINIDNKNLDFDLSFIKSYKINKDNYLIDLQDNKIIKEEVLASFSNLNSDYEILQKDFASITIANQQIWQKNTIFDGAEIYEKNNYIFFVMSKENEKYLVVLDNVNNIIIEDEITTIEHKENGFQTLLILNDIQKQGKVKKYELVDGELTLTNQFATYLNSVPKRPYSPKCNNIAFFECIKAQNLKLARVYLTNELSNKITLSHIEAYFGDFTKI